MQYQGLQRLTKLVQGEVKDSVETLASAPNRS